jgi:hypothetical protein
MLSRPFDDMTKGDDCQGPRKHATLRSSSWTAPKKTECER